MSTSPPAKPKLKLTVGSRQPSFTEQIVATPSAMSATGGPKIRFKTQTSEPPTPAEPATPASAMTKAGRQTKPTAKKRQSDHIDGNNNGATTTPPQKKIKVKATKVTKVAKVKTSKGANGAKITKLVLKGGPKVGTAPKRPHADGYDSEASDREVDPHIEEQFVLRMMPGEHCTYVQQCIDEHKIGEPKHKGGADIQLHFFEEDSRRAMFTVKGQPYAAVLVDLPTITESMKTWDRKSLVKSADISQMLLVFKRVSSEIEAKTASLPSMIQPGYKWPHGITPPMHDCVSRRFAKVTSSREIEQKEAAVERLLQADNEAISSTHQFIGDRRQEDDDDEDDDMGDAYDGEQDADGEVELEEEMDEGIDEALLEEMFEAALGEPDTDTKTPGTQADGVTPMGANTGTPADHQADSTAGLGSGDDVDDDDDDDDDDDIDDDEQARLDEIRGVKEDIADLKRQLEIQERELVAKQGNLILRNRVESTIRSLKAELQLKLSSIGEDVDE
jgi:transcription initiation factor TFIID subunit 7